MAAFLLALLAALAAGVGGRDQMLVAALAARRGPTPGLLLVAVSTAAASAALAGWAGMLTAPQLVPLARTYLTAMALGLAAIELLVLRPRRIPREPTESLGALAVVLLSHQLTDAARLLVFALAASSAVPVLAVAGGIAGCVASAVFGWTGGARLSALPLRWVRFGLGLVLAAVAIRLVL